MSTIEAVGYTGDLKDDWNEFVATSNNGTIFHSLDFLSYHGDRFKLNERHLMFYRKGRKLIGVMPLAFFEEGDSLVARSPYGGSFGGVVVIPHLKFRENKELVDSMMDFLRINGVDEIHIAPPPLFYGKVPDCYIEFSLMKNNFDIVKRVLTSVIKIDYFSSDPFEIFEKRARTAVKKARKEGVCVVESSDDYGSFYEILKEAKSRHQAQPTHTLQDLRKLHEILPGFIKLDMAYVDKEPVAGVLYFICNSDVVLAFYICHKTDYNRFYPANLLIHAGMSWAKMNNFKYLDLGATDLVLRNKFGNIETVLSDNLFMFKESFGSVGYFRDTYALNLKEMR